MITEKEFKKYKEVIYFTEPKTINNEKILENFYNIVEWERKNGIIPNSDFQNEGLDQNRSEVYIILFWGTSALVSTLLWLFFFIERFSSPKVFSYFN